MWFPGEAAGCKLAVEWKLTASRSTAIEGIMPALNVIVGSYWH